MTLQTRLLVMRVCIVLGVLAMLASINLICRDNSNWLAWGCLVFNAIAVSVNLYGERRISKWLQP